MFSEYPENSGLIKNNAFSKYPLFVSSISSTCLLIPFIGTVLGSSMVFLMKNKVNKKLEKILLGFASGVMIAASVWSLLIPSIDMAKEQNVVEWIPATIGFLAGMVFLLILDSVIPHLHLNADKPEGVKSKLQKSIMRVFAIKDELDKTEKELAYLLYYEKEKRLHQKTQPLVQ